jgi:hypothetical protein
MTLTTPSDGPTLLVALIRTDHDRLVALLHEAAVPTPTPGVSDDLRRQLTASVSAHLNAEAVVALGAIREVLGADAHAERAPELTATLGYRFSDVIEGASRKP